MKEIKSTLIDKIIFLRSGILNCYKISNRMSFIETKNRKRKYALKFSYPGNVQYHQITRAELDSAIKIMEKSKEITDVK